MSSDRKSCIKTSKYSWICFSVAGLTFGEQNAKEYLWLGK
jgi:hypothetical protein